MKLALEKLGGKLHDPIFNRFLDIRGLKAENRQFCLP